MWTTAVVRSAKRFYRRNSSVDSGAVGSVERSDTHQLPLGMAMGLTMKSKALPFGALRTAYSTATRKSDRLIARFEIITEPSIAIQHQLATSRITTRPSQKIAVFADAVYTASDPRVTTPTTTTAPCGSGRPRPGRSSPPPRPS